MKNETSKTEQPCTLHSVSHFYSAGDTAPYTWDNTNVMHGRVDHTSVDKDGDKWLFIIDEENNHRLWFLESKSCALAN